ncbi:MAG: GGDEF domain-containing protein [Clostridia bacterium]|nr:GGDEF domain-containing protein [Clostridia bacterium]
MDHKRRNIHFIKEHYFSMLLIIILLSFVADILSSLYLASAWIFPLAAAGNYFEIILNTLLLPIFHLYVCTQISDLDVVLKRRINSLLWIMAAICSMIVLSSVMNKKVFYFDEAGIYHRGPLLWLPMSILFLMMFIIEGFIINQRRKIEISHYKTLLLFLVCPIIGTVFQFFIYGLPFTLISITFAAQVVFTNIQNRSMDTDYLTGVFNRRSLDHHMQHKIDTATNNRSFSALLLDIDNFKLINDGFGHYEGDLALINTTKLLRNSVSPTDFIARYGGDEFCIILSEDDSSALDAIVQGIYTNLREFNKNTKKPYKMNFSIGYAVYQPSYGRKAELFLEVIDQKMYIEKNSHKVAHEVEE